MDYRILKCPSSIAFPSRELVPNLYIFKHRWGRNYLLHTHCTTPNIKKDLVGLIWILRLLRIFVLTRDTQ
jgi:hypothetical protein